MREKLASRIGFIFLSAGCAIGLGNVWRFPYVAGKSGGGWFVLFYLVSLALLGIPILAMEFAAGRAAQRSIAKMHSALVPEKRAWRLHGVAGFVGNLVLMMFYTVVTGWMLIYFCRMAAGRFDGLDTAGIGAAFNAMLGDPVAMGTAAVVVTAMAAAVCSIGLQKGVERVSKVMMGMLLALIVVLAVRSVLLPGAGKGVAFYLVPDFAKVREIGVGNVFVEAMNQAFFTLSLGIGSMAIFGSYIGRRHQLFGEAMNVAALDTSVALAAGLIVIPACFAFGIEPAQGPGLVFVTLPNVFNSMPLGRLWGSLFFAFMGFAALTSSPSSRTSSPASWTISDSAGAAHVPRPRCLSASFRCRASSGSTSGRRSSRSGRAHASWISRISSSATFFCRSARSPSRFSARGATGGGGRTSSPK